MKPRIGDVGRARLGHIAPEDKLGGFGRRRVGPVFIPSGGGLLPQSACGSVEHSQQCAGPLAAEVVVRCAGVCSRLEKCSLGGELPKGYHIFFQSLSLCKLCMPFAAD